MAQLNGQVLHSDQLDITNAGDRERFIDALGQHRPGIDPDAIREELLRWVGDVSDHSRAGSQSTLLVELVQDVELFHTPGPDGVAYATILVQGHRETSAVESRGFKRWLQREFWNQCGTALNSQSLQEALGILTSKARFDGPEHPVAVRLARHGDAIYLDLGDSEWRAVKITAAGWQVVADPPVKFLRRNGMEPLPIPVSGGEIDELRRFINIGSEDNWTLILAWLMAALRPEGPYPVLVINGEQGCAKSTLGRVLRALIDPNSSPLRAEPREIGDLMIAASNAWVVAFDNLSHIQLWLSDALCRLATGGGFGKRELYTDGDEKLFHAMRPALLNGIEDLATRSDLLDRCICLTLPTIPEDQRRTEAELWREFEQARPRLLGALLDGVSAALKNLAGVKLDKLPRMADFAQWATAAEPALGLPPGAFMSAYAHNREAANDLAIEASAVGPVILDFTHHGNTWHGTVKELLGALSANRHCDAETCRRPDWPRSPQKLAGQLRRLAPNLRKAGIVVEFVEQRSNRGRRVILRPIAAEPSPTAPSAPLADSPESPSDLGDVCADVSATPAAGDGTLVATGQDLGG